MNNPWETIDAIAYEGHMKFIKQYDLLNHIFKEQVTEFKGSVIGILGIGCGNGIEHVKQKTTIYGYDINTSFLNSCKSKYKEKDVNLILNKIDLMDRNANIHSCELLICNLVLEFIGIYNFLRIVNKCRPEMISVVLQMTINKENEISKSPYKDIFQNVSSILKEIYPQEFTCLLDIIDYRLVNSMIFNLNQYKHFIRMDFKKT